jgi:hypothetical protein
MIRLSTSLCGISARGKKGAQSARSRQRIVTANTAMETPITMKTGGLCVLNEDARLCQGRSLTKRPWSAATSRFYPDALFADSLYHVRAYGAQCSILSSANKIKATVIVIFILPARSCIIRYLFQAPHVFTIRHRRHSSLCRQLSIICVIRNLLSVPGRMRIRNETSARSGIEQTLARLRALRSRLEQSRKRTV